MRTPKHPMRRTAAIASLLLAAASNAFAQPAPAPARPTAPAQPAPGEGVVKPLSETLTGEAKSDYELGRVLFLSGDYPNSLAKFQHAYSVSSDPRLLWNMVACASKMHRYKLLLSLLDTLRKSGGNVISAADWAKIEELDRSARALVGYVALTVDQPGAEVFLDEDPVGVTPLAAPVMVDAGSVRIRIAKPGFRDYARVARVDPGANIALKVDLETLAKMGTLSVTAGAGQRIALDGKVVGEGQWEGRVPSGGHTLRVTAPGMMPYQSEVVVQDDQTRRINIALTPMARSGVPLWVWIGGGALLAVGAVISGVVLAQPDPAPPVNGTLADAVQTSYGARQGASLAVPFGGRW